MKTFFLLPFIIFGLAANATNYYLASNGNDANNGTSQSSPWQSLNKLNSIKLLPGDNIYFRRGDTFFGKIATDLYGSASDSITFSAYGTGAKPIITGLASVTSWSSLGSNIWESTKAISTLETLKLVVINGVNTPIGRFPDSDAAYPFLPNFLTFQSHSGKTSITSSGLSGGTNWIGADVVVRQNQWTLNKSKITGQSGTTLTLAGLYEEPYNGWGLYIQNDPKTLSQQGEWYYNPATKKIRIYSVGSPVGVQVATIDTLFSNKNHGWPQNSYISIKDINFIGANTTGIALNGIGHSNISGCDISFTGEYGIYLTGLSYFKLESNLIMDCGTSAIEHGNGTNITIIKNTVKRAGLVSVIMPNDYDGVAITFVAKNSLAQYNRIDSSGHGGISFRGSNCVVRNNFITYSNFHRGDNGGIYTAHAGETGKIIDANIILNSIGNGRGTSDGGLEGYGIYLDDLSDGVTVTNNTVANCGGAGFFLHNSKDSRIYNNTFYNNGENSGWSNGQIFNQSDGNEFSNKSRNNILTGNIFFARTKNQAALKWYVADNSNYISKTGILDSNYYAKPIDPATAMKDWQVSNTITTTNLATWKARTNQDLHSKEAPTPINDINDLRFEYNASNQALTIPLGAKYIDVKENVYNGTITLQPWSSAVLIKIENSTQTPIDIQAGENQEINLPINNALLKGNVINGSESIKSYEWKKISGGFATIETPANISTIINDLVEGVYIFELTVTDNIGTTVSSTVQVTVNAAPNIPPTVNAGDDLSITLPENKVTLSGSGTDTDGSITKYQWTKKSGPVSFTIVNASNASTDVTELAMGVYVFELTVTDNDGATATSTVQVTVNAASPAPVADAGEDKIITLPKNNHILEGSGFVEDGSIEKHLWTKKFGPNSYNFSDPNSPSTEVINLNEGVYIFELKVTDNRGATATSTVQVTVNAAPNKAPTANAGANMSITLPENKVTLTGSGTDTDGTITKCQWTKKSGPTTFSFVNAASPVTEVNNLIQGVYVFELTVTDNNGATATSTVQVTVNAAPNKAPTANAGANMSITLPENKVTLTGSGTDTDGTITKYQWTKKSGPTTFSFVNAASPVTEVNNLIQGDYVFELIVTDNHGATATSTVQVTVNAAPNKVPTANAGANKSITLPENKVTLTGSGTDTDGTIAKYQWTKKSGPTTFSFVNAASPVTEVNNLIQGVYVFELTVTDNNGATATSTVQVTVNAAPNKAPTANAGANMSITLPTSQVTLTGSGSDEDGTITKYQWTKKSGPSAFSFVNAASPVTEVNNLSQGVYVFELTVTDNDGATATSTVQVTVNAAPNKAPTANAGANKSITLPENKVTLTGSGTDTDGTITKYQWTKKSGPTSFSFVNAGSPVTEVNNLIQGVYVFELTVTDNNGATATSTVQVTVNAALNKAPTANAGANKSITLPENKVTLTGSGSDEDGTITKYQWTKKSGTTTFSFVNAASPVTEVINLNQGDYVFELTVTDNNGATATSTVQVTVNKAVKKAPTSNSGANKSITLPENKVTLTGSGSVEDGTIIKYQWIRKSGPTTFSFVNAASPVTEVNNLSQGVYIFELTVTDDEGATATSSVQVTVNAAPNKAPTANAGVNKSITLPENKVTLTGSGTDTDGTIVKYQWTKKSGPTEFSFVNAASPVTEVNNLSQGVYIFELTVTDDEGATATSSVQVTVNAAPNKAPTANAGASIEITLPINKVSLAGSGTDEEGTITAFLWTKKSGPSAFNIVDSASPFTEVTGLIEGEYIFELMVTNNKGLTSTSTTKVTVNPEKEKIDTPNTNPTADAGEDITITEPLNQVTLNGKGSTSNGEIIDIKWIQISGPSKARIDSSEKYQTMVRELIPGTYEFQLTVKDRRGAEGKDTVKVVVALGRLARVESNSFKIYPNPVRDIATLDITSVKENTVLSLMVTDINGRIVMKKPVTTLGHDFKETINLSNLIKGVYTVTIQFNEGEKVTYKIIKM